MSLAQNQTVTDLAQAAELEAALLKRIQAAADDLQRVECLNEEQRAEIHAILEALKHDSESHRTVVAVLTRGRADA